ncbi:MAG TPA: glycosyltransferase [Caldilineaceae bacterium]|nr:glycosyltransferase [Caldilineaceae bacterium]
MSTKSDTPVWWPPTASKAPTGVVIASVNYNTKGLIAQLLWSIHRFLGDSVQSIVIVDNGSTDGSVELLQAVAAAGLCELIVNAENRHHGPALSQAISYLAQRQQSQPAGHPWVWLLDSDCLIARADAATAAIDAATVAHAALVGEAYWNQWHDRDRFSGFSLLLDPAQAWRAKIGAIPDDGDPIGEFEQACRARGVTGLSFPFTKEGYLIHLGRSTLAAVRQRAETENPLYTWALDHHDPHFQQVPEAHSRHAELISEFNEQVPTLDAAALIRACRAAQAQI